MRGGVPVIFPWFGPQQGEEAAPQHGFARTAIWSRIAARDGFAESLELASDGNFSPFWPHPFRARLHLRPEDALRLRFEVDNTGEAAFQFECALHTYFAVSDVRNIEIEGLDGATYLDKNDGFARKVQSGSLRITEATDRVHLNASGPIRLRDRNRNFVISNREGWRSTIVWNPFEEAGAKMSDVGEEWRKFLCIECGAVAENAVTVNAGEKYALDVEIHVETL